VHLGVDVVDMEFTCCGYPVRSHDRDAFVAAAARNLAIAEAAGVDILTPCKCCFGNLRHAMRFLDEDQDLKDRVSASIAREGLAWSGRTRVEHLLPVLAREVGFKKLAAAVTTPQTLRVAAHYGCHALRPSGITGFDNPIAPTLFEDLVRVTGATPVDWPRRLDCCGAPLKDANGPLADRLTRAKLVDARESGAEAVCSACTYCHLRFSEIPGDHLLDRLPLLLYPHLLGQAMGLSPKSLGMD
jgi:heterodisulfide reductase subunit B